MNKLKRSVLVGFAVFVFTAAFAQMAVATPSKTSSCTNCHSGTNVPVTATLASVSATAAIYDVSAPTAGTIALFSGTVKQSYVNATTARFTVVPGKTYTIYAVKGPKTSDGIGQTSVSPVAPVTDSTPPVTTSNALATYVSNATISLSATDTGGSGVAHTYYRLDGAAQVEGVSVSTPVVGTHTLEFWSVDTAGNAETPHKTVTFKVTAPVDATAPVTSSDALAVYVGSATIALSATDAGGSGVAHTYYRLDGAAQVEGVSVSTSVVGTHTVEFWSVDGAGNTETPHKTATFKVNAPVVSDTVAPSTTSNAVASYTTTAVVKFTAVDNAGGSGVLATYYRLDGAPRVAGTSVVVGAEGTHTIEFWSEDKGANEESPHKTATFVIDRTAPVTASDAVALYSLSAAITLSAADAGSGVATTYYVLDGAAPVAGTSIATSVVGTHTIEFWSVDKLGNVEAPRKTATFRVASAPLVVKAVRTPDVSRITKYRKKGVARYTLAAKIRDTKGAPLAGVKVVLQMREKSSGPWVSMYSRTSSATGRVSKTIEKRRKFTAYYRWYVPATGEYLSAKTLSQKVVVK